MTTIKTTIDEQKRLSRQSKNDFALHVALIMKTHSVPKSKAYFLAWCEGYDGLNKRLGQDTLPLEEGAK